MDLGLYDPAVAGQVSSGRYRLIYGEAGVASRDRDTPGTQDFFRLVFVYFHREFSIRVFS